MLWLIVLAAVMVGAAVWPQVGKGGRPLFGGGGVRGSKRCQRCFRNVNGLRPYEDGRSEFWICDMCYAELEIAHAPNPPLPRA